MKSLSFQVIGIQSILFLLFISPNINLLAHSWQEYRYPISHNQKYVIPSNVMDGDYVGVFHINVTDSIAEINPEYTGSPYTFKIIGDNNIFVIDQFTGLVTINNGSKIKFGVDHKIKIEITEGHRKQYYIAKIQVANPEKTVFVDYGYSGTEQGTREQPFNHYMKDVYGNGLLTSGTYVFIKRGETCHNGDHIYVRDPGTVLKNVVITAYGKGPKPVLQGNNYSVRVAGGIGLGSNYNEDTISNIFISDFEITRYDGGFVRTHTECKEIKLHRLYGHDNVEATNNGTRSGIYLFHRADTIRSSNLIQDCVIKKSYSHGIKSSAKGDSIINVLVDDGDYYTKGGHNISMNARTTRFLRFIYVNKDRQSNLEISTDSVDVQYAYLGNAGQHAAFIYDDDTDYQNTHSGNNIILKDVYIDNPRYSGAEIGYGYQGGNPEDSTCTVEIINGVIKNGSTGVKCSVNTHNIVLKNCKITSNDNGLIVRHKVKNVTVYNSSIENNSEKNVTNTTNVPVYFVNSQINNVDGSVESYNLDDYISTLFPFDDTISNGDLIGSVYSHMSDDHPFNFYTGNNCTNYVRVHKDKGEITIMNCDSISDLDSLKFNVNVFIDRTNVHSFNCKLVISRIQDTSSVKPIIDTADNKTYNYNFKDKHYTIQDTLTEETSVGFVTSLDTTTENFTFRILNNVDSIIYVNKNSGEIMINDALTLKHKDSLTYSIEIIKNNIPVDTNKLFITIKHIENNSLVFYIDPSISNASIENGTIDKPFNSWHDVIWKENAIYLQKRGTSEEIDQLMINADSISIGAYGIGENPIIISNSNDNAIYCLDRRGISIRSVFIRAEQAESAIHFQGFRTRDIIIEHCTFTNNNHAIKCIDGDKITVRYNQFNNNEVSILSTATMSSVYYNLFSSNEKAIEITSIRSNAEIFNNTFYNNGIAIKKNYGHLSVYNNIFYLTNDFDAALVATEVNLVSDYNLFYPETESLITINDTVYSSLQWFREIAQSDFHSISAKPLFLDIHAQNFRIHSKSPCAESGKYSGVLKDLSGTMVPYGRKPDIGAYELTTFNEQFHDDDGDNSLNTTEINNHDDTKSFQCKAYPNPTNGILRVDIPEHLFVSNISLQIINQTGDIVRMSQVKKEHIEIDLSSYNSGIYFLKITTKELTQVKKIMLQQ